LPEMLLQRALSELEISFELQAKELPGTPDISIPSRKIAIYVHGCYWHRHEECVGISFPSARSMEWAEKFNQIVKRDRRTEIEISKIGWVYNVAWECAVLASPLDEAMKIQKLMWRIDAKGNIST